MTVLFLEDLQGPENFNTAIVGWEETDACEVTIEDVQQKLSNAYSTLHHVFQSNLGIWGR